MTICVNSAKIESARESEPLERETLTRAGHNKLGHSQRYNNIERLINMTTNEMTAKINELKELEQMQDELKTMIESIKDELKKREICTNLCRKFIDDEDYIRKELESAFPRVCCLELSIEHLTGKPVNKS